MTQNRNPVWFALLGIGIAGLLIGVVVTVIVLFRLVHQIEDCLNPEGECYQRAQEQRDIDQTLDSVSDGCAAGIGALPAEQRVRLTQQCIGNWLAHHDLTPQLTKD